MVLKEHFKWALVGFSLIVFFLIVCLGTRAMIIASSPAAWSVSPTDQRFDVQLGKGKIIATYRVSNRGGHDLTLGEISSTCGCSVAFIERRVLKPGETGTITVEATPPGAGERTVEIEIATNTRPQGNIHLRLTMESKQPLPYVADSSGPLQFGFVHERIEPEPGTVWFETRENRQQKPWFCQISHNVPGLKVTGGFDEELPFGGDIVVRRYRYKVELTSLPKPGEFGGELNITGLAPDSGPIHRVRISGTVRPPVHASPSALYANYKRRIGTLKMMIRFSAADPVFRLVVEAPKDLPKHVTIRHLSDAEQNGLFELLLDADVSQPVRTVLTFMTNHPDCPIIQVPLMLNLVDSDSD